MPQAVIEIVVVFGYTEVKEQGDEGADDSQGAVGEQPMSHEEQNKIGKHNNARKKNI